MQICSFPIFVCVICQTLDKLHFCPYVDVTSSQQPAASTHTHKHMHTLSVNSCKACNQFTMFDFIASFSSRGLFYVYSKYGNIIKKNEKQMATQKISCRVVLFVQTKWKLPCLITSSTILFENVCMCHVMMGRQRIRAKFLFRSCLSSVHVNFVFIPPEHFTYYIRIYIFFMPLKLHSIFTIKTCFTVLFYRRIRLLCLLVVLSISLSLLHTLSFSSLHLLLFSIGIIIMSLSLWVFFITIYMYVEKHCFHIVEQLSIYLPPSKKNCSSVEQCIKLSVQFVHTLLSSSSSFSLSIPLHENVGHLF